MALPTYRTVLAVLFVRTGTQGVLRAIVLMHRVPVTVVTIYRDENEVAAARGGENLRLRLSGIDEEDIQAGFVICSRNCPVRIPSPS